MDLQDAFLVALELRQCEPVGSKRLVGFFDGLLDDHLDVLQLHTPFERALLRDHVAVTEAIETEDQFRPSLHRRVTDNRMCARLLTDNG